MYIYAMGKYLLFFSFILISANGLAQGLVKEEIPREFVAPRVVSIQSRAPETITVSTDSLAVQKWNSISQSYEKLQYLRTNGLISRKEFVELKTRLLLSIQEYQVLLNSEDYIIIDN